MATPGIPRTAPAPERAAEGPLLRDEAVRFGRYLVGGAPSAELVERYVRAHAYVLREPPTPADEAVLAFVHAHPWSLPLLDAGTALVRGAPRLRRKLLVMMAILEATPEHAERTLPQGGVGLPRLALRLGRAGATAAVKLVAGAALAAAVARGGGRAQRGGG
jgi:hypothetical protein